MADKEWKSRKPMQVAFEEKGAEVSGKVIRFDDVIIRDIKVKRVQLKDDKDVTYAVLLTCQLESMIAESDVGKTLKITYLGKIKTGKGFMVKDFNVEELT